MSTEATNGKGGASEKVTVAALSENVRISSHPVLSHKITILRSSSTPAPSFRSLLREVTYHLGYEATSSLTTRPMKISVPLGHDHLEHTGSRIQERVALIPILRSGLGLVDAMLELLPNADVHHIGMYKSHSGSNHVPIQYYNRLPRKCESDIAYVLDPVIGTASTVLSVVGILKKWGVPKIHVISVVGSLHGLQKMTNMHPDVKITVGVIDEELNEHGEVLPGLGDTGNRLFHTPHIDDDEYLIHPSKRKRSDA